MRIRSLFLFLTFLKIAIGVAQPLAVPEVPHKVSFAGITLSIRDDARREIQKDVDALMQSPRHFAIKVERAKAYFPIIEKIFAEENLPNDFKYLVLQESALIGDAVSVSNAVGFWQFKDFTAREVGLRVDDLIDERMNIASATRGAARYIKKNNYQFNNWIYALQAYQMGAGGVSRSVSDVESGTKHMTITSQTYWYVKKFLAHKIAFEGALQNKTTETLMLTNVTNVDLKTLSEKTGLEETKLRSLNLWIRKNIVPDDKVYALVVPANEGNKLQSIENTISKNTTPSKQTNNKVNNKKYLHGLPVVYALGDENMSMLAQQGGISLPAFMRYNDLHGYEKVIANSPYYLKAKHKKGKSTSTVAKAGQDLWQISQQEGVRISSLKKFNKKKNNTVQQGEIIWLASRKPRTENISISANIESPELDNTTFNWEILLPADSIEATTQKSNSDNEKKSNSPIFNTTPIVLPVPSDGNHEVRPGETLSAISRLYAIPIDKLITLNSLAGTNIQPGQKIKLVEQPPSSPSIKNSVWHEVKAGETLYAIARQYGVTIKEICDWNNKKDFDVKPGEKLKVEIEKK